MKTPTYFRFFLYVCILIMGIFVGGGAQNPPAPNVTTTESNVSDVTFSHERTACHGSCPVYKLTFTGDGTVIYEGQDFVLIKGRQTANISPDQIRNLVSAIEEANFLLFKTIQNKMLRTVLLRSQLLLSTAKQKR
jgi:hypothetical protein